MRKSKWIKNHHPPIHTIKHFGILVSGAENDISSTLHGTDWIKHKILKWTPYGVSTFADSLRGIKPATEAQACLNPLRGKSRNFNYRSCIKIQLSSCFCSFFFFLSYPIMLSSGPKDSASTQRGAKPRVYSALS